MYGLYASEPDRILFGERGTVLAGVMTTILAELLMGTTVTAATGEIFGAVLGVTLETTVTAVVGVVSEVGVVVGVTLVADATGHQRWQSLRR